MKKEEKLIILMDRKEKLIKKKEETQEEIKKLTKEIACLEKALEREEAEESVKVIQASGFSLKEIISMIEEKKKEEV